MKGCPLKRQMTVLILGDDNLRRVDKTAAAARILTMWYTLIHYFKEISGVFFGNDLETSIR